MMLTEMGANPQQRHLEPYIVPHRPWLALYGLYLTPKVEATYQQAPEDLAPIQSMLPDEMLLMILAHVPPYTLGKVACVCRHWRALCEHPRLWEAACREAYRLQLPEATAARLVITQYRGSWRRMFLEQPHLRFDGLYVSRNQYVKVGVAELSPKHQVHVVLYYRYYRFFPDGTLLYRTSPQTVSKVAKSMVHCRDGGAVSLRSGETVFSGRYVLKGTCLYILVVYPNSRSTEIRSRLLLRSTHTGANNRLDIQSIVSYDKEVGAQSSLLPPAPDLDPQPAAGVSAQEHRRGLTACVFVPWEQAGTSVLNLPASQMDIFIPG